MSSDKVMMLLSGSIFLLFSIWLFFNTLEDTKNGYKSGFGNDVKLYLGSVLGIILGCVFIYKTLF